jgi:TP901 family phage tail tape measure protein
MEKNQTNILKHELRERQRLRNIAALEGQNGFKKLNQVGIPAAPVGPQTSQGYSGFSGNTSTSPTAGLSGVVSANQKAANDIAQAHTNSARRLSDEYKKSFMGAITEGTSFGHKMATTAQYMAAGAGLIAMASGVREFSSAIIDADKAMGMFQAVLEMQPKQAKDLQEAVFGVGVAYGGTLSELNETALALGRAGIANEKLAEGIKSVSQLAMISGESLGTVTDVMVSWSTLYQDSGYGLTQLGDIIVKVANESKASVADFNTMSTYILTAGQQAGLTAEALAAMGGAWKQIGKGSSTSGTEIRRFFNQLETGSADVRKAYDGLGISIDKLRAGLASTKTGESDATMLALFERLKKVGDAEGKKAIEGIGEVLDKATMKSLLAIAKSGEGGLNEFKRILAKAQDSSGIAEEAANKVALTYEKMWERIKNSMSANASVLADSFAVGFAGAGATVGSFDERIKSFDRTMNSYVKGTGESIGNILARIVSFTPQIEALVAAFVTYKMVLIAITSAQKLYNFWVGVSTITTTTYSIATNTSKIATERATIATIASTAAQKALNLAVATNPYVLAAGALAVLVGGIYSFIEANDKAAESEARRRGIKNAKTEEDAFAKTLVGKTRTQQITMELEHGAALSAERALKKFSLQSEWGQIESNAVSVRSDIEQLNRQIASSNKRLALIKAAKKNEDTAAAIKAGADITGRTLPKGNVPTQSSIESDNKNALDERLREIELAEQKWVYDSKITSELEIQKHHINVTLRDQLKATENAGEYKNKTEDTLKKKIEIWKATNALVEVEYQNRLNTARTLEDLDAQLLTTGNISDAEKIRLDQASRITAIDREREDLRRAGVKTEQEINDIIMAKLEVTQALTTEQERQFKIQKDAYNYSVDTASVEMQTLQAITGAEQVRLEQMKIERDLQAEILKIKEENLKLGQAGSEEEKKAVNNAKDRAQYAKEHVSGAETYNQLLRESNVAYERNNTIAKGLMRVTEDGISKLSDGLSGILTSSIDQSRALSDLKKQYNRDIASAKDSEEAARITQEYNKQTAAIKEQYSSKEQFKKLTREIADQVMKGLIQELVVNQMILQIRQLMGAAASGIAGAFSGAFTGGGSTMAGTGFIDGTGATGGVLAAKGGVFGSDGTKYLAKGGSYVNSIVTSPTYVAKGTIAGEAGAEAVIPLQRDSQGRLGVNASGSSSGPQNITISIKNESGEPLKVTKSETRNDISGMVLDIVIDAIARNKRGMRDIVRS